MEPLFLDAGYVIALEAADDQNHQAAFENWQNFLKKPMPLVTTSYVFDEIVTFFNSRNRHEKAVEIGNNFLESKAIELIQVDENLFFQGWVLFQKYHDKTYSLTDCISFAVMTNRKIRTALTFDKHFLQAGFENISHK